MPPEDRPPEPARAAQNPAAALDPVAVRRDFPVLNQTIRGKPLIYLDHAATSQKPASVIRGECEYYGTCNANVHRAIHYMAEEATRRYEEVRRDLARFLGAPDPRGVIFTRGTTESINLVAHSWGRAFVHAGDVLVLTEMEHHSNLIPWQQLAAERSASLRFIGVRDDGTLDLNDLDRLLEGRVKLVAVTHMSNVLGTVNPIAELARRAHAAGALLLVDAAQSVPHFPVSFEALGCDFLALSGHKMCGPTGTGALVARPEWLDRMPPFMSGGEMIARVDLDRATWAELPHKFEAGTPNIAGVIGWGAALQYLDALGMEAIATYEEELTTYAIKVLDGIPGLRLHGRAPQRGGALSFSIDHVHPHDLAQLLDRDGIAIRAGHLCAQPLMRRLGVPAVNRASLAFYNLKTEIDVLARSIEAAQRYFGHGR